MGQHGRLPHILVPQAVLPPSHLRSTTAVDLFLPFSLSLSHSHPDAVFFLRRRVEEDVGWWDRGGGGEGSSGRSGKKVQESKKRRRERLIRLLLYILLMTILLCCTAVRHQVLPGILELVSIGLRVASPLLERTV